AMLPAYLLAKHLGISLRRPVKFANVTPQQKQEILRVLWQLGGLQGKNETGKKRSVLFPNAFKSDEISSNDFYQAGTDFTGLVGRLKDTVEKKNINVSLFVDNNKQLTLPRKYKDIINDHYLKNEKLSLKHFACWVFRFVDFDFQNTPNNIDFTRVINKAIRHLFKINKNDFLWLFEDDILSGSITPSSTVIPASDIRDLFTFKAGQEPEIELSPTVNAIQAISVARNQVEKYIQLTGDNPTDKQIYDTLLQTKQLVLTGVPGIGKSRFLNNLKEKFYFSEMIQFHANYSYEEFIGGDTIEASSITSKRGKFLDFVERANSDQNNSYLFIIDELNRGNIAQIFGETILTLDRGY
ncbi:AAA family ATPase, partial [Priestia megaterium]